MKLIAAPLLPALLLAALAEARPAIDGRRSAAGLSSVTLPKPQHHGFRHLLGDCFACSTNCAKCSSVTTTGVAPGFKAVTIDASSCKNGDLSWMCCRGASDGESNLACMLKEDGCFASPGTPVYDYGKAKCDSKVQKATFIVPDNAAELTVQLHDGRAAGNVDCGTVGCCGGNPSSCGTGSGVCQWTIDLIACEDVLVGQPPCSVDTDCPQPSGDCVLNAQCVGGECVTNYQPSRHVCGTATGDCEVPATCTGSSSECPANTLKPAGAECRAKAGPCDVAEQCTGASADCPDDVLVTAGTECRAKAGPCDVAEQCTGASANCPADGFVAAGTECRAKAGPCDVAETCSGMGALCPVDAKMPSTTVCRPAVNKCDKDDYCTGTSNTCPEDVKLRDKSKVFKCGRDCFYCGMPLGSTVAAEMTLLKNTWALGSCNVGSCDNHVFLTNPSDITKFCGDTLPLVCPNGKAMSNVAHAVCAGTTSTWDWNCIMKQEAPFAGPVVAPWAGP